MTAPASTDRRPGERLLSATAARVHRPLTPGGIARRRFLVTATKWLLPVLALALLSSIALWPELDRATDQARVAFRRLAGTVDGAHLRDARYHGVDEKNRPYTITATTAVEVGPDRIDLTLPKGDVTLDSGTWLMVEAKQGVFIQRQNMLDLSGDVLLYRDDGTTMRTAERHDRFQGRRRHQRGERACRGAVRRARRDRLHPHRQGRRGAVSWPRAAGDERGAAMRRGGLLLGLRPSCWPSPPGRSNSTCRMAVRSRSPRRTGSSGGRTSRW